MLYIPLHQLAYASLNSLHYILPCMYSNKCCDIKHYHSIYQLPLFVAVCITIHLPRNEANITNICNCSPDSDSLYNATLFLRQLCYYLRPRTKQWSIKATGSKAIRRGTRTMLKPTQYTYIIIRNNYDVTAAVIAYWLGVPVLAHGLTAHHAHQLLQGASLTKRQRKEQLYSVHVTLQLLLQASHWKPPTTCHVRGKQ